MYVVMNRGKWNQLPKDVQQVFESVSQEWIDVHGEQWDKDDEAGRAYTLSLGNEILELSDAETARWEKAVQPIMDDYVTAVQAKGLDGEAYVRTVKELITTQNQ